MKTFKLTVTEGELTALIHHHSRIVQNSIEDGALPSIDTSERIHHLTKRLNKDTPKIDADTDHNNTANQTPKAQDTAKDKTGW